MIDIKVFAKSKNGGTSTVTNSSSSSNSSNTTSLADTWFYFNDDNGFVTCRYPLCSVDNVVAFADGTEAGGGSGGGSGSVEVIDNLTSTDTEAALSANQGRVLKSLIDNAQTSGSGTATSIDWANVTNKPSTFPPSAHTHSISDVTGLQTQLNTMTGNIATNSSNLTAHINDSSVHVTQQQHNVLSQLTLEQIQFIVSLMNMVTISNGNLQINGNVHAAGNVVANVQTV